MRAIWSGSISFGLVNIPVKLYSATESKGLDFRMLHKKHLTPIKYQKWCPECEAEVPYAEIVKGIEIRKDEYIPITPEELKALRPQKSNTVDVREFVDTHQIDPIYYSKHYYLAPNKAGEKAYFLFREVLSTSAKAAICTFIMREKEQVCAVRPYKNGLVLSTLNYAYEVRSIDQIEELKKPAKLTKEELDLASQLINRLYKEEFDISEFKDNFADEVKKIIERKSEGEEIEVEAAIKKPKAKPLIEALKASLK